VEVAAAIVALGMLAVALVPALAATRAGSKEDRCFANLMRIGFANAVYASRELSDPALPVHGWWARPRADWHHYPGAYEWGGKSGVGIEGYVDYPGVLGARYGSLAGFGPPTRPLNAILYKTEFASVYQDGSFSREQAVKDVQLDLPEVRCPSDTGYTGIHFPQFRDSKLSSYDFFGTSYTANMFMVHAPGGVLGPDFEYGEIGSNSPFLHRLSELTHVDRTLAYYENVGRYAWSAGPTPTDCVDIVGSEILPGPVTGWHGETWVFNGVFIDGHADRIFMRSFDNPQVHEDGDAQRGHRCIIIRGENWNKDTLPVPFARTRMTYSGVGRPSFEGGIE